MSDLAAGFQSLPAEYQHVIRLAQERHSIAITPLQALAGGWSGAIVYLVSVAAHSPQRIEHIVLKLDRKNEFSTTDETQRHAAAVRLSPPDFVAHHLAHMAFERVEADGALAIFYTIAGQSLRRYRTLAAYDQQSQIETIFASTYQHLLGDWNAARTFRQAVLPPALLEQWLAFRLKPGNHIEKFLETVLVVPASLPGFLIQDRIFPNPLAYARNPDWWGPARPIDVAIGLQHGDLNTGNILVKFAPDERTLEGYYLIDFALFREGMPLLLDLRYLEMSYLVQRQAHIALAKLIDLTIRLGEADRLDPQHLPVDVAGIGALIGSARQVFDRWVRANHPSLHDDLWGQYWLAGVAAGLSYCHKPALGPAERLTGLIYSAANLKCYADLFGVPTPGEGRQLYGDLARFGRERPSGASGQAVASNAAPRSEQPHTDPAGHGLVRLPADFPQRATLTATPNNLPTRLTPLLGRERETTAARQLLARADVHLVTITGPGGVGKTSLAVQVAQQALDSFADGVFYVSLAPISDATLVLPTVAQALGLPESPRRLWLDSIKDHLQDRQVLLLLDNFEQIIMAAPLLTELLSACAGLRLLVTSREVLRLRGEQEFLLSPLALPGQPAIEALLACPSAALFVQRAQAAQPEFRLTLQNAAAVAEICARLDGLPLALELAAARIRLLPPQAMLAQLRESPLRLLSRGARDLPERQQTLRRAVQWSYDLLDDDERRAFRWLAVFVGGSTLEAALAVLGPSTSMDVLDSLLSKSLLRQAESDATARLVMLETIREFGLELLSNARDLDSARRAHALHYLSFVEGAEAELTGPDQKTWLQRLDHEQDNLRAALRWAIEQREGDTAQRLAGALQPFWLTRGHWSEGRRWLEDALALDAGAALGPAVRAKALYGAGTLARFQGDFARARMLCEQSLALYRALADQTGVVEALVELCRISSFQGDQPATDAFLAEAVSRLETLPDTVVKASAYSELVVTMITPGALQYPPEAARYLAESERIHRALNNPTGLALVLTRQGSSALFGGDYSLAASQLDEAERLATELGDERILSRLAGIRVLFDLQAGDFAAARVRLHDTFFQQAADRGDHQFPSWLPILAAVLHGQGLEVWSARVLGLVEAMTRTRLISAEAGALWQRVRLDDIRAEVRAQLGDEVFAKEMAAGQRLTLDDLRAIPQPQGPAPAVATAAAAPPTASGTPLTAREIEVLRLLDQDLSNPQIAERLVVSRRTVDAHLRSIYDKLGVKSRAAAIRAAHTQGVLGR